MEINSSWILHEIQILSKNFYIILKNYFIFILFIYQVFEGNFSFKYKIYKIYVR
jgi:hypothetical protein